MKCAREACKTDLKGRYYKIQNDPCGVDGCRKYCLPCGRKIVEWNKNDDLALKFTIEAVHTAKTA